MAKGRKVPPVDSTAHRAFIQRNADLFTKTTREGYDREGRGAIVVQAATIASPTPQVAYTSEQAIRSRTPTWLNAAYLVSIYDPKHELVVAFEDTDGSSATYLARQVEESKKPR